MPVASLVDHVAGRRLVEGESITAGLAPGETLSEVTFLDCDLSGPLAGAVLGGVTLEGCRVQGSSLAGSAWPGSELVDTELTGVDLTGIDLRGARLSGLTVTACKGLAVAWGSASASVVAEPHRFIDCRLDDSSFFDLDLAGVVFRGCRLHRCDFEGARLVGAQLRDCDLMATRFVGSDLRDADLRGSSGLSLDVRTATVAGLRVDPTQAVELLAPLGLKVETG